MKKLWISMLLLCLLSFTVPAQAQEGMVVGSETVVIHPDQDGMDVHTILNLVNTSSSPQDVVWKLPETSSNVQILVGGDTVTVSGQEMKRNEQLAAGANVTIVYKYRYSFPNGTEEFRLPFPYPAQSLQILLPTENKDVKLTSSAIQNVGAMDFQGKSYISYVGQGINTDVVKITVDVPSSVPPFHSETLIKLWSTSVFRSVDPHLLTAILVVLVGGSSYLLYRRFGKKKQETEWLIDEEEQRFLDSYRQSQVVFTKLAELQAKLDAGKLTEGEFADKKAAYKEKLVALKVTLHELTAEGERK